MLAGLRAMGLTIIAASNPPVFLKLKASGLWDQIDHLVESADVGAPKRGPAWVDEFVKRTGLRPNEFFYVGDSDNDMVTATRGPMTYAHAMWSPEPPSAYGLRALSPVWVVNVVRHIFMKRHPWYWTLDGTDGHGRPVQAMTLIDADGAGNDATKRALLRLLKDDIDIPIRNAPMMLRQFVMLHMLASVYDSNLFGGTQLWTTYPGHTGTPNDVMGDFLKVAAKLSRNNYTPDLFIRHKEAIRSRDARKQDGPVGGLRNQLETMHVNIDYLDSIVGKRVLLLDNFLTWGYSTEGGRTLLLQAGAAEVVVACVAKYGPRISVISPSDDDWSAFEIARPDSARFPQREVWGNRYDDALDEFVASLYGMVEAPW